MLGAHVASVAPVVVLGGLEVAHVTVEAAVHRQVVDGLVTQVAFADHVSLYGNTK